jgi:hypothetical protein
MRHRLSGLEHISENTINEAEAMSAEEEVLEIMDSLGNVRELRPSYDGRAWDAALPFPARVPRTRSATSKLSLGLRPRGVRWRQGR